jgi:hypothetical protein
MNEHTPADILVDYRHGSLEPAAAEAIRTHLSQCPECQAVLHDIDRLAGLLADQPQTEPSKRADQRVEAMIRKAVRPPVRRLATWARLGAVAAGLLLAVAGVLLGPHYLGSRAAAYPVVGTITAVEARVVIHREGTDKIAEPGMALRQNDRVTVPPGGSALLTLPDHARAELGPQTVLSVTPARELYLQEGFLAVEADERPSAERLRIRTPTAEAEARGRFHVGADEKETHMRVAEGSVGLTRLSDGVSVDVPAGHHSTVASGVDPKPVPARMGSVLQIITTKERGTSWDRFERIMANRIMGERLWRLGFRVETCTFEEARPEMLAGRALVIVSVFAFNIGAEESLRRLGLPGSDVPVICLEPAAYPVLGLTGPVNKQDFGWDNHVRWVDFPHPEHALSAGWAGSRVELLPGKTCQVGWGKPAPTATIIMRLHQSERAGVFAYEAGAALVEGRAPARRMGLFLDPATVDEKAAAAWSLFEAAVEWCVEAAPSP